MQVNDPITIKQNESILKKIVKEHVKPVNTKSKVTVKAFYKSFKLSSAFSTRPRKTDSLRNRVVYQFECSQDGCKASYIGYTTGTLERRNKQHRYNPSSIYQHFTEEHQTIVPGTDTINNHFKILHQFSDTLDLKIAESISIRETNPYINVKFNEMSNNLNLYS